ncbi:MAG: 4-hydroxythreonine-4-phosphate dehydrogenase PdxA [Bacteriovoracaceae bacterium]|jgi:4-hydroxythreonine-4-phosphate dehydrogenase|nr:4-hydroxythreonine-4-phosphate dehydrogenase PdxA [Bacteriovoracaceae bacterium]
MIYVSQGHEKSVSLEIFLKSFLCQSSKVQNQVILYCYKETLIENLEFLKLKYSIYNKTVSIEHSKLSIKFIDKSGPQTLNCLSEILKEIKPEDFLLTLPSSKDQFGGYSGHTDFFRNHYNIKSLPMSFLCDQINISLLTDHIPLKEVSKKITKESIIDKINIFINGYKKLFNLKQITFSGINPHSGENGILGNEEENITNAIKELNNIHQIKFIGPIAADTLVFNKSFLNGPIIFSSHDQGLGVFKTISGFRGINITFGLPFIRISPDHGTAFDLYRKNEANYESTLYIFKFLENYV